MLHFNFKYTFYFDSVKLNEYKDCGSDSYETKSALSVKHQRSIIATYEIMRPKFRHSANHSRSNNLQEFIK